MSSVWHGPVTEEYPPTEEYIGNALQETPSRTTENPTTSTSSKHPDLPAENADDTNKKEKKEEDPTVSAFEIFQYANFSDRFLLIVGSIAAFLAGGGMPGFSFVFGRIITDLTDPATAESKMAKTALIMVYIELALFFLHGVHTACFMVSSVRQAARIRKRFFESVLRQDIGWHDEHTPGELIARMTGDTRVIQNGINDKLSGGIVNLGMTVLGFAFGFVYCWQLTLLMLGVMPFLAIMGAIMGKLLTTMTERSREHFAKAGAIATEVLDNIRTVQTFGKEEFECTRFSEAAMNAQAAGIKKEVYASLSTGMTYFVMYVSYFAAFFFSSYLIQWGDSDASKVTSTFFSVLMGSFALGMMFPAITTFTEARAAAFKVFGIINRVPSIDIDAAGLPVKSFDREIELRNIRFSYPTRMDQVLFTDLSLTIKKGQKVAFSGATGCGKSSLIGLIQRFYDPLEGDVLVDGVDMRKLTLEQWRDQIGIVSQEPNLFSGSMMENVLVGKPDATEAEVHEACRKANIHETILSLPAQYQTPVGAVGSQLSGGQKQRIAIARAIIKKPSILLLDEATSALDRKSELEVQTALNQLMESSSMTVIIIAHRLATIRSVDRIFYLDYDGATGSHLAETGTFAELMALGGRFAAMANSQGVATSPNSPTSQPALGAHTMDMEELANDLETRTERQQVPIEELVKWEVERAESSLMRVMKLNREHWWAVVLGLIGSLITGGIYPVWSILFGKVMYQLQMNADDPQEMRKELNLWCSLFIVMGVAALGGWALQSFYGYAGELLTTKIRGMLFRSMLRQDASFFDTPGRDSGSLSGMLSGDCESVHQLWGPSIGLKVQMGCNITVGIMVGLIYRWQLALVCIACLPLIAGVAYLQQLVQMGMTKKQEGGNDDAVVTEALSNVRTVASFNMKRRKCAEFVAATCSDEASSVRKGLVIAILYGLTQFVFFAVFALCFWYGGKLVSDGKADFQEVMIASMSVLMGAMGAGEAAGFAAKMADAEVASKRVFCVIDRTPDVDPYDRKETNFGTGCHVEFRGVKFIYPARPQQVVLAGVNLTLQEGTATGLMGQTGCGKSTIVQLLARFYPRRGGSILVNGQHDLQDIDLIAWRQQLSIVLQEPSLFSGTVRDNIRYGRHGEVSDAEIEEVARIAQVHDDIMAMPNGYDTEVGYKGRSLSGGQKQRVAIARGLLRKSRWLLLDEATSALDNVTEARVQQGLEAYQRQHNVTVVSIAHRLTTIRNSDKIILLDSGRIIEQGNHHELMALGGEYKTRYELYVGAINNNNL